MKKMIGLGLSLLLFTSSAAAVDLGIGVKAGTNGAGVELSVAVTKTVNLRLSAAKIDIEGEDETVTVGDDGFEGDVDAELDFDYGATALFFDWHIFNGGFHLTAGMFKNNGAADFSGTLLSNIVIDGQALATDDLGPIGGEVSLGESYQPYLGIGWGRKAGGGGGLSITVDVGVALLDPSVDLEATVLAGTNGLTQAELDSRLRAMESDAEAELDEFELWPVLAVGVNYAF